jgi:N-acetylmuramoyl-L-alanine amidase
MKATLTALMLLAAWPASAATGVIGLERAVIAGAEYVRVGDWAERNDLKMIWRKKEDPILVTNQSASVRLTPETLKAQINGLNVSLSLPVISRNGVPWISLADAQKTLQPILFPQKSAARVRTICLDPGHGGADPGTRDGEHSEKQYTLLLARAVEKLLQAEGFNVVLTRTNDVSVDLPSRPALAAKAGADLFVSLHYNSGVPSLHGVEVHYMAPAGMKSSNGGSGIGSDAASPGNASDDRNILLAYQVLKSITASLPLNDIAVKHSHLAVLREARMPAILIEPGFMSDPQDAKNIYDSDFRQRMARSIVDGILAYKKAVEETEIGSLNLPARPATPQGRN